MKNILYQTDPSPKDEFPSYQVQYLKVATVEDAKAFFGPIDPNERAWRSEVSFKALLNSARSKIGIGEHDRSEAYIFGNEPFPKDDKRAHLNHFPVSVKVITAEELSLDEGELLDISATREEFPWQVGEKEMYLRLNVKRLILNANSKLLVRDNVFILDCHSLIGINVEKGPAHFSFRANKKEQRSILSSKTKPIANGKDGSDGRNGIPYEKESTPLGPKFLQPTELNNGADGADGAPGQKGHSGANGSMLFLSDLRFQEISGFPPRSIIVSAFASNGFDGVAGSNGGKGGNGGKGVDGGQTAFGAIQGTKGGKGGVGGKGGDGGNGGNGGLSCDTFISAPFRQAKVFLPISKDAIGGDGGLGGFGGKGGTHGRPESPVAISFENDPPMNGKNGKDGAKGRKGKTRPGPKINIYERNQPINE